MIKYLLQTDFEFCTVSYGPHFFHFSLHSGHELKWKKRRCCNLRTFASNSSYGEIFFISPLDLVDKVLTPKMKKKMGVTDFVSEKMAVEKCLNLDKSVIITRCSLLC